MKLRDLIEIVKDNLADLSTLENPDFRLEQAEKHDTGVWEIVISYLVENTNKKIPNFGSLGGALSSGGFEYVRLYKKVKIDADGEVVGIFMFDH